MRWRPQQGCHNGRFWMKITVRTSACVRIYPADVVLPADGFLPSADATRVRVDTVRPCGHGLLSAQKQKTNLFIYLFLVVVAVLKREKKISVFGFQSPRSPRSPRSPGFASEVARRRRFFRPSTPSHPSKLYSSLGLLNSKVPKPLSPFSLRLIDVDGF
jgi:hypothetical protein